MRKVAVALVALALGACGPMYDEPYGPSGYPPDPYPEQYPPSGYPPAPYPEPYPPTYPSEPLPPTYPPEPYPPTYPPPAPYPPAYPVPPVAGDYRAVGTEPFWDLTIGRDMTFIDRGTGLTIIQPAPAPIQGTAGPIYRTQRLEVIITHTPCSDGMSDRSYPDTVQVYADGRLYRGCGGASADPLAPVPPVPPVGGPPAPPLERTRWTVVAINNRPTPPAGDYFIEFDAGRISAKFGCNGIGAGYTQTGSTLDAGAVIATRMACPDMSWENLGTAVLDQVMTINNLAPNRISLTSSAGSLELVRR